MFKYKTIGKKTSHFSQVSVDMLSPLLSEEK